MSFCLTNESHLSCFVSKHFLCCPCYSWQGVTVKSAWRLSSSSLDITFIFLLQSAAVCLILWYFWFDQAGATFHKKSGLGALPQALFNGVPFPREEMDAAELETLILQRIFDASGFFQRAVFMVWLTFLNECRMKYLTANCFSHVHILWGFL